MNQDHDHTFTADLTISAGPHGVPYGRAVIHCDGRPVGVVSGPEVTSVQVAINQYRYLFGHQKPCHVCTALADEEWNHQTNGFNL